jgi:hypothetical protein
MCVSTLPETRSQIVHPKFQRPPLACFSIAILRRKKTIEHSAAQ